MAQHLTTGLAVAAVFAVLVAPVYLMFRFFVKLIRVYYGFDVDAAEGPPLRICGACHNTVMEREFAHCPYCGAPMVSPPGDAKDAPS